MIGISDHYRLLSPEEVPVLAAELENGWKHPAIPRRQWISVVRAEIERFREGERFPHFDALLRALKRIPIANPSLLEIGASSGFYREILRIGGFDCQYTGCDISPAFKELAEALFPGIAFDVANAVSLPYRDGQFAVVVDGGCLLNVMNYEKAISETARVAKEYAVFYRTPVLLEGETQYFEKESYGVRMIEIRFSEYELERLFRDNGLELVSREDIFIDEADGYSHRTYLLKKQ